MRPYLGRDNAFVLLTEFIRVISQAQITESLLLRRLVVVAVVVVVMVVEVVAVAMAVVVMVVMMVVMLMMVLVEVAGSMFVSEIKVTIESASGDINRRFSCVGCGSNGSNCMW
jgi:hypothetical protein